MSSEIFSNSTLSSKEERGYQFSLLRKNGDSYQATLFLSKIHSENIFSESRDQNSVFFEWSEYEEAFMHSIGSPSRQRSFAMGRYLARQALLHYLGRTVENLCIRKGVFGHPYLEGEGLQGLSLSISHSPSWAGALIFNQAHPMALDIEAVNRHMKIPDKLFSEEELFLFKPFPELQPHAKVILWSMRESLGKGLKIGLTLPKNFLALSEVKLESGRIEGYFAHFYPYKSLVWIQDDHVISILLPRNSIAKIHAIF